MNIENVQYEQLPADLAVSDNSRKLIEECAHLYCNHYGNWSKNAPYAPGKRIKLSADKIQKCWLGNKDANLYTARLETLIGYAIAIRSKYPDELYSVNDKYGVFSWVTQLVVHEDYRKRGIAKRLLFSIWGQSDDFAWGVLTANPYAIRALEKATRRRCSPERISKNKTKLFNIACEDLGDCYEINKGSTQIEVNKTGSKIDTKFFVDHSQVPEMIKKAASNGTPWVLGDIEEGWEWFAFTFNDQDQLKLTKDEVQGMIDTSDQVAKHAYSRMLLNEGHNWSKHTKKEIDFIIEKCGLMPGKTVLDMGCGKGRHALALAEKGLQVTGVDYVSAFIENARQEARKKNLKTVKFSVDDGRKIELGQDYDAVICLYDVIGSFIDEKENKKILANIARSLKPGGIAIITVLNYELTIHLAQTQSPRHVFSFDSDPNKVLDLAPAEIMEKTGNIFDPAHYLVDEKTHIVYRNEQFTVGGRLPEQLIVMDKRYTKKEITDLCEQVGLKVQWAKYVGAGKWRDSLNPTENAAKEIMVFCEKHVSASHQG
uniref:Methyltransferase domain-containing protein n=1 Tax=Candidatus Kentrum sp. TUN TaxID=2126343 RepID=A0A450ZBH6_9GAMM|nr:MAG: Methyltransferase domain-containing protein [Candidatus Kentron sp. TUN]VFK51151.1 MAG: Methyltransferase domain-containing protein [Candidatus Kentron sp. TUN]VFK57334.1 MAG: Methyltransferase domain-containing protein [Candidatus Kentron sp. TUN]